MKRTIPSMILGLLAASAGAQAQSTVTVFGALDLNLRLVDNEGLGSRKSLSQDGVTSSRLGFRGEEDLGDGLKAGFWIEGALQPDVGNAAGQSWQRRSTVQLRSNLGELRLGRDYTPTFYGFAHFDPFGTVGLGSSFNVINTLGSSVATLVRSSNSIGYYTPPTLGGFYAQAMVAAGEGAVPSNKFIGLRSGFQNSTLHVAASHSTTEANAAGDEFKFSTVGASYKLGTISLMGYVLRERFLARSQTNWSVGLTAPVGAGVVKAAYIKANQKGGGTDGDDADLLGLGYVHNLSKRTALYAEAARVSNKGASAFALPGGPAVTAATFGGRNSSGFSVGMLHTF